MQNRHLIATLLATAGMVSPAFAAETIQVKAQSLAGQVSESASDTAVTAKVKASLLADKDISGLDIHVTTNQGVVTLEGTVDRPELADRAAKLTASVAGVKGLDNQLKAPTVN